MLVPEVVIPSESLSSSADVAISHFDFDSSSKDTNATSPSLVSPRSILPKAWIPLGVDMVDLVSEDEGENQEEDMSYEEDQSMDKEDLAPEIIEEDSSQDSSKESY